MMILWCGLVAGFFLSCAWFEKQDFPMKIHHLEIKIKDLEHQVFCWKDLYTKKQQPRLSNGRFVSRKQIVTEALRIEQLKKQAAQFPEF